MARSKRRESGRQYNKNYDPENGEYYEIYWDDWNDYRDGYRNIHDDGSLLKPEFIKTEHWGFYNNKSFQNQKIKKLNRRRKLMKTTRK